MKCQQCRQPIQLHPSLEDLNPASINLLLGASATPSPDALPPSKPVYPADRRDHYLQASTTLRNSPLFRRSVLSKNHSIADSFVVLTQSQITAPPAPHPPSSKSPTSSRSPSRRGRRTRDSEDGEDDDTQLLSKQLQRQLNLFEVLSARTDVDHPVCTECSELLVEGLTKRLAAATKERDAFVEFLNRVNEEIPTDEEKASMEADLARLQREEEGTLAELKELEAERREMEEELRRLEAESKGLEKEEEEFWKERNAFALQLEEFKSERDGVNLQYDHDSRMLERLQRTNVYNDTFCITHDGYFGTINGLRLGRLPNQQVEWTEINAAWGQTLLLLHTIAEKLHFTFSGYRLKPLGSSSRIDKLDPLPPSSSRHPSSTISTTTASPENYKITSLELFSSGDLPIGGMFMHRKFDQAMVAFLECLRQLGAYVEQGDPSLKLPYNIVKDKIDDACIRLAFNQTEAWTRACKYTLTCVKFLLAHTSNAAYRRNAANT